MIINNEKDISQRLKERDISNVYYITGEENYIKKSCSKAIIKASLGSLSNQMNLEKIDAQFLEMDKLIDSVLSIPFLGDRRCVVVDDIDIDALNKQDKETIIELISDPNPTTIQIYISKDDNVSASFLKAVDKEGTVVQFKKRSNTDLVKYIKNKAGKFGCVIDSKLASLIVEFCSSDMNRIISETDKLFNYKENYEISKQDIITIVTKDINAKVFDLWSNIFNLDYANTINILSDLVSMKEEPISIIAILAMNISDIYKAKIASAAGKSEIEISKDFNIKSLYRISMAKKYSSKLSFALLREYLDILSDMDYKLKSNPTPGYIIIQQGVTKMFVKRQEVTF